MINDEETVFGTQLAMGRSYVAPVGVPADRLQAIRAGFQATVKDPGFLAEARRLKMFVDPSDHEAMLKVVNDTYAIPPRIIDKAIAMIKKAKLNAKTLSTKKKKK